MNIELSNGNGAPVFHAATSVALQLKFAVLNRGPYGFLQLRSGTELQEIEIVGVLPPAFTIGEPGFDELEFATQWGDLSLG